MCNCDLVTTFYICIEILYIFYYCNFVVMEFNMASSLIVFHVLTGM